MSVIVKVNASGMDGKRTDAVCGGGGGWLPKRTKRGVEQYVRGCGNVSLQVRVGFSASAGWFVWKMVLSGVVFYWLGPVGRWI